MLFGVARIYLSSKRKEASPDLIVEPSVVEGLMFSVWLDWEASRLVIRQFPWLTCSDGEAAPVAQVVFPHAA